MYMQRYLDWWKRRLVKTSANDVKFSKYYQKVCYRWQHKWTDRNVYRTNTRNAEFSHPLSKEIRSEYCNNIVQCITSRRNMKIAKIFIQSQSHLKNSHKKDKVFSRYIISWRVSNGPVWLPTGMVSILEEFCVVESTLITALACVISRNGRKRSGHESIVISWI